MIRHARRLLGDVQGMLEEVSDFAQGAAGRVRVHANASAMCQDLPARLARWSDAHPHIKLEVQEARSTRIVDDVRQGLADVGVVTTAPTGDLRFEAYRADRLCVVVPGRHPLRARSVAFASLLDHDFVSLDSTAMSTILMQRAADAAGRFLKLRVQVHSFEALCRLVSADQGVGVMPLGCAEAMRRPMKLRTIALTDVWAHRTMNLCTRHGRLAAPVSRFFDYLLDGGDEPRKAQ